MLGLGVVDERMLVGALLLFLGQGEPRNAVSASEITTPGAPGRAP